MRKHNARPNGALETKSAVLLTRKGEAGREQGTVSLTEAGGAYGIRAGSVHAHYRAQCQLIRRTRDSAARVRALQRAHAHRRTRSAALRFTSSARERTSGFSGARNSRTASSPLSRKIHQFRNGARRVADSIPASDR